MKSFKKLLVLSFSVLLPFAMVSCGKNKKSEEPKSEQPSVQPSQQGSEQPSVQPSEQPSEQPSVQPSEQPSVEPSEQPSEQPSTPVVESIAEGLKTALLTEQNDLFRNPITADFNLPVKKVYFDADDEQQFADITWEVVVNAGGVENAVTLDGDPENSLQAFKVIYEDTNDVETTFKVTGHIVVSDSDEATVEFNGTIPAFKWATLEEFLQAAKDNSTDVLTVKGRVTTAHTGNGVFIVNEEGEGFYAFKPKEYNQKDWKQGDLVKVSGTATIFQNTPEFNQGCTVTKISDAEAGFEVPYKDVTEEFAKVTAANQKDILTPLMNAPIRITGAKVTDITPNSTGNYFNFTVAGAEGAAMKYYYRGSTSYLGITSAMLNAPESEWVEGYTVTIQGVLSLYSGNYYVMPVDGNGYEITDRTLNDQQAVNAALTLFSSTFRTDYRVPQEVLLDSEDSETGASFAYTLEDGATALSLSAGKLIVSPLAAETTVKLTVTATRGEGENEKTASKDFNITVGGTTYETVTADFAAEECDKLDDKTTSAEHYYIAGKVSKITKAQTCNFELETTNGKTLVIYGLYNPLNPTSAYGTERPEGFVPVYEGEEVVIYGQLSKYGSTLEVVNGQLLTDPVKTLKVDGTSEGGYTIYSDEAQGCQLGDYTVAVDKNGKIIFASRTSDGYGGPGDGFYHDGSYTAKAGELCGIFNLQADWAPWPAETCGHYSVVAPEQGYIITGSFTQMAELVGQIAGHEYTDLSEDITNNVLFENTIADGSLNKSIRIEVEGYVDPDAFKYTLDASKAYKVYAAGEKMDLGKWWNYIILDSKGRVVYTVANAALGFGSGDMYARAPMYADSGISIAEGKVTVPANCFGLAYLFSNDDGTYGGFASAISDGQLNGTFFDENGYDPKTYAWNKTTNSYITNKTILSVAFPESGEISLEMAYVMGKQLASDGADTYEGSFTLKDAKVYTSGGRVYVTDGSHNIQLYADKGEDNKFCTAQLHDDYLVTVTGKLINYNGTVELAKFTTLDSFEAAQYKVTLSNDYENVTLSSTDALENLDYGAKVKISAVAADGYTVTKVLANDAPVAEKDGFYEVEVKKNTVITAETMFTKELNARQLAGTENFGTDRAPQTKDDGAAIAASDETGISFQVNGLDVSMTKLSKVNGKIDGATGLADAAKYAYDAQGNATLKLGTGSAAGKFTLTVPANVVLVKLHLANYGNNVVDVILNGGDPITLSTKNDNGEYLPYEVEPNANHQVTFEVAKNPNQSKLAACMLNKIELFTAAEFPKFAVKSTTADSELTVWTSADYKAHDYRTEKQYNGKAQMWNPTAANPWRTNIIVDANGRICYLVTNGVNGFGGPNAQSYYVDETIYPDWTMNPAFVMADDWAPWPADTSGNWDAVVPEGGFAISCHSGSANALVAAISGGEFTELGDSVQANVNKRHDAWNGGKLVYDKDNGQVYYYKLDQSAAPEGFVANKAGDGSYTFAWAAGGAASTKYLLTVKDASGNVLSGFNRIEVTNGANFAANKFDYDVEYTASLYAREEGKADSLAATAKFTRVSEDANISLDFEEHTTDSDWTPSGFTALVGAENGVVSFEGVQYNPTSGQMRSRAKDGSRVVNAFFDTYYRIYAYDAQEVLANTASIKLGNYWSGKKDIKLKLALQDYKGNITYLLGDKDNFYTLPNDTSSSMIQLPTVTFAPIVVKNFFIVGKCDSGDSFLYIDDVTLKYEQLGKGLTVYNDGGDVAELEYNRVRAVWTGDYTMPSAWGQVGLRYTANDNSEVKMIRSGSASVGGAVQSSGYDNAYDNGGSKLFLVDETAEAAGLWMNPGIANATYRFTYNPRTNGFWVQLL